jgi:hypothetical protein
MCSWPNAAHVKTLLKRHAAKREVNALVLDPRAIHIYADGSCYENPGGDSGCAAIVRFPEHLDRSDEQIVDFGWGESSINRMELLPCIEALRWVFNHAPRDDVTRVLIVLEYLHVNSRLLVKVGDHRTAMPCVAGC